MRSLGDDLVSQDVLVVIAGVDRDAGLLLERRHQRLRGLHMLSAVERDGVGRGGSGSATTRAEERRPEDRTEKARQCNASSHGATPGQTLSRSASSFAMALVAA